MKTSVYTSVHLFTQNSVQSLADHRLIRSCDYDLDPMTLICYLDLDIQKMYLRTKMNFLDRGFQKLERYRQTDTHRQMRLQTLPCRIREW